MKAIFTTLIFVFAVSLANAKFFTVAASGATFSPSTLSIHVGDTVHWTFAQAHDVTSGTSCTADNKFKSGPKTTGDTFNYIFKNAGSFPYYCSLHCTFGMVGSISVEAVSGIALAGHFDNVFNIYPNPSATNSNLSYSLSNPAKVNVAVTTMTGQQVITIEKYRQTGNYQEVLEMAKMAKGMYMVQISLDGVPAKEAILVKE